MGTAGRQRAFRVVLGLTQTQLCKVFGVKNSTYSQYENGKRQLPERLPLAYAIYSAAISIISTGVVRPACRAKSPPSIVYPASVLALRKPKWLVRRVRLAIGRPNAPGYVRPGPAPQYTGGTVSGGPCRAVTRRALVVFISSNPPSIPKRFLVCRVIRTHLHDRCRLELFAHADRHSPVATMRTCSPTYPCDHEHWR